MEVKMDVPISPIPVLLSTISGLGTLLGGFILLAMLPRRKRNYISLPTASNIYSQPDSSFYTSVEQNEKYTRISPPKKPLFSPVSSNSQPLPLSPGLFGRLQAMSAGVMILLSLDLLLIESAPKISLISALLWCLVGGALFALLELAIDKMLNENTPVSSNSENNVVVMNDGVEEVYLNVLDDGTTGSNSSSVKSISNPVWRTTLTTYIAMALHNFPEGVCLGLTGSSPKEVKLGISLCVAILLHNVLEGVVVALPLWYTTGSRIRVLWWTLLNGLVEPVGCLLAQLFVYWLQPGGSVGDNKMINYTLAVVAGVMISISVVELLPSSIKFIAIGRQQMVPLINSSHDLNVKTTARDMRWMILWTIMGTIMGSCLMYLAELVVEKNNGGMKKREKWKTPYSQGAKANKANKAATTRDR
ncbi:hypothetical protein HK096_004567 [Nowakowskiella sp. JEL0078]|nr:hypothetical protein HK096_004567 [Nowakowskiella sp. JEL0078]